MQVPQIRMESQLARIQLEQQHHGTLEIQQPKADLSIEQPKADVSIQTTKGTLTIDQSQAWEDMNLMSTRRHIEKFAQEGMSGIAEGTGRRAEQGTEMMRIENDSNPIYSQAIVNGGEKLGTIGMKYIPSVFAVKIDYEPGSVDIDITPNRPIIDAVPRSPEIEFNRGGVNISMAQYNELHIDYVNLFPEKRV